MKYTLRQIANMQSGIYAKPEAMGDTLYLQGVHFKMDGQLDRTVPPSLRRDERLRKHLLQTDDILFAAKGLNNFAVVYDDSMGPAVASSSFIVIRLDRSIRKELDPRYLAWYLGHAPEVKLFHKQLGTTIPSISISAISELEIGVIPMERQQLILQIQNLRYRERQLSGLLEEKKDYLINHQLLKAAND